MSRSIGWVLTLHSPLDTPKAKRIADQWAKVKYAPCISAPMKFPEAREVFAMRKEALEVQALLTAAGIPSEVVRGPEATRRNKSNEQLLLEALDNLVGEGAQHEDTCDEGEHALSLEEQASDLAQGKVTACIYCEARAALATVKERRKLKKH